jgi:hypothetical protein
LLERRHYIGLVAFHYKILRQQHLHVLHTFRYRTYLIFYKNTSTPNIDWISFSFFILRPTLIIFISRMRVVLPYRLKRSIFYKDINLSNNTGLFAVFVLGVFASVASAMLTPYVLHATTNSGNFIFLKTVRKTAFR